MTYQKRLVVQSFSIEDPGGDAASSAACSAGFLETSQQLGGAVGPIIKVEAPSLWLFLWCQYDKMKMVVTQQGIAMSGCSHIGHGQEVWDRPK